MNGEGFDVGGHWILAIPQVTLNEMTRQPLLGKWRLAPQKFQVPPECNSVAVPLGHPSTALILILMIVIHY
jgi:hypothetical protein